MEIYDYMHHIWIIYDPRMNHICCISNHIWSVYINMYIFFIYDSYVLSIIGHIWKFMIYAHMWIIYDPYMNRICCTYVSYMIHVWIIYVLYIKIYHICSICVRYMGIYMNYICHVPINFINLLKYQFNNNYKKNFFV